MNAQAEKRPSNKGLDAELQSLGVFVVASNCGILVGESINSAGETEAC